MDLPELMDSLSLSVFSKVVGSLAEIGVMEERLMLPPLCGFTGEK